MSLTAALLRQAEHHLTGAVMAAVYTHSFEHFGKCLSTYSDALLAHHNAVEAKKIQSL